MRIPDAVRAAAEDHPYPLLFATISGAHLYGFPSPDSDWDLRGCHVLPADEVLGLGTPEETVTVEEKSADLELDLVTHDAEKFFRLMLRPNGYVLEQLYSPLVVRSGPEHQELLDLGRGCITRHHVHHYLGFARNQWKLFAKEEPPRIKPLLYVYRVLLTGIHLMRTGAIEANLTTLAPAYRMAELADLMALKTAGRERDTLPNQDLQHHERRYRDLLSRLEEAGRTTDLPEQPSSRDALSDLLVRLRLGRTGS